MQAGGSELPRNPIGLTSDQVFLQGRCLLPLICDKGWLGRDVMAFLSYLIAALYLCVLPLVSYAGMAIATLTLGSFFGLAGIFYQSLVGQYLGTARMKVAFGLIMFFKGVFFFAKPAFIGNHRYTPKFSIQYRPLPLFPSLYTNFCSDRILPRHDTELRGNVLDMWWCYGA